MPLFHVVSVLFCAAVVTASLKEGSRCLPSSNGNPSWLCTRLDKCPVGLNLIQNWKQPLPVKQKCGYKGSVLLICCPPYDIESWVNPVRITTTSTTTTTTTTTTITTITTSHNNNGFNAIPASSSSSHTTTSHTSNSEPWKPPTDVPAAPGYLGCYQDQIENRLLVEIKERSDKLTITTCIEYCSGKGFPFAGPQNGAECSCGFNRPSQVAKRPDNECSKPCSGNSKEKCGGFGRISVYQTTVAAIGAVPNGFYMGCFKELNEGNTPVNKRIFPGFRKDIEEMTPKQCFELCFRQGYRLAGIQNGVECYCSSSKQDVLSRKTNDVECRIPCPGDNTKNCGGEARLSVYATGLTDSPVSGKLIGCYEDSPEDDGKFERVLGDFKVELRDTNSPRTCLNLCHQMGYTFAGVEYGSQCYCGMQLPPHNKIQPDGQCDQVCPGDQTETCGGQGRLQTYRTSLADAPGVPEYLGCYQDQTENRLLSEVREWNNKLTIDNCIDLCAERGFPFAGPQYGSECFCGYNRPPLVAKRPDEECSQPCSGDRKKMCGGLGKVSVFKTSIPAVGALPNGYHLGCFRELEKGNSTHEQKLFPEFRKDFDIMTPKVCFEMCFKKGYKLSGIKYGKECYCSNTKLDLKRKTYDADCKMPCGGDNSLYCGGEGRLSVYSTGLTEVPVSGRLIGCYEDAPDEGSNAKFGRAMGDTKTDLPETNTPETCLNMCYQMGFHYAGNEYEFECFCALQRPSQKKIKPDGNCSAKCPGDKSKTCGGGWRVQVYRTPLEV